MSISTQKEQFEQFILSTTTPYNHRDIFKFMIFLGGNIIKTQRQTKPIAPFLVLVFHALGDK